MCDKFLKNVFKLQSFRLQSVLKEENLKKNLFFDGFAFDEVNVQVFLEPRVRSWDESAVVQRHSSFQVSARS